MSRKVSIEFENLSAQDTRQAAFTRACVKWCMRFIGDNKLQTNGIAIGPGFRALATVRYFVYLTDGRWVQTTVE